MPGKPNTTFAARGTIIEWVTSEGVSEFVANKALSNNKIPYETFGAKKKFFYVDAAEQFFFPAAAKSTTKQT
ncbi:MAG TPA: hypothetical protein VHC95_06995 [Opitutales bacterium]|nr:hypothetical protein [Opitutales bacterium]